MGTMLYPRLSQSAPAGLVLPAAQAGFPTPGPCYLLDTAVPPGPQQSLAQTYTNVSGDQFGMGIVFCSRPLVAQSLPASAGWSIGGAASSASTSHGGNGTNPGNFGLFLNLYLMNGANGVARGSLFTSGGSTYNGNFGEETILSPGSATAQSAATGDYLALVMALYDTSSNPGLGRNGTVSGVVTWYTDGTTAITSNGAPTSSAQAFVSATLSLVIPLAAAFSFAGGALLTMDGAAIPPHFPGPVWR